MDVSVEWRVSNVSAFRGVLLCGVRNCTVAVLSDLSPPSQKQPLYCVQQVAPVHFVLIFMNWMVCSVRGRRPAGCVCVCVLPFYVLVSVLV